MDTHEKNRKYILDLFKIVGTNSILVIDRERNLRRLYFPLKVVAIVDVPPQIAVGEFYWVESVKMTLDLMEVYIIGGKGYYTWIFRIL